jgi:hypothetical protein
MRLGFIPFSIQRGAGVAQSVQATRHHSKQLREEGRVHGHGANVRDRSKQLRDPDRGPVTLGRGDDPHGLEGYIRSEAVKHGVDPDTAVRVAKSEGLRDFSGDHGTSFGAFQLHKKGGLGDQFQKETGLDPADPKNERATISWALQNAKKTGWEPYHGAARVGIGHRTGIDRPAHTAAPGPVGGDNPAAFIMHHTGGRGSVEGVKDTLNQRGLGVEYVMDREGNISRTGDRGAAHMLPGWGKGEGLSNRNTVGMEVIARDNGDVTPQQVKAAKAFIEKNYPTTPVFGHGEVNPGHKEADEGMAIVNAIRADRKNASAKPEKPFDPETIAP